MYILSAHTNCFGTLLRQDVRTVGFLGRAVVGWQLFWPQIILIGRHLSLYYSIREQFSVFSKLLSYGNLNCSIATKTVVHFSSFLYSLTKNIGYWILPLQYKEHPIKEIASNQGAAGSTNLELCCVEYRVVLLIGDPVLRKLLTGCRLSGVILVVDPEM